MNRDIRRNVLLKRALTLSCALMLVIAAAALTGCSSPAPVTDRQPSAGSRAADSAGPGSSAGSMRTFGIIYPFAHPFYEMITEQAQEAALPNRVQLIVKAPEEANLEQQIRMMETMIKQGVDGIALNPLDSEALQPSIDKAVAAGIPVICFESDAPGSRRLAYIGADNREAGIRMGQLLAELLKGKGMVLVESGMPDMSSLQQRMEGLLHYLNRETDIQVLDVRYNEGNEEQAVTDLEQMIDRHPHFDALVSLDSISNSSSILVWKAKGLNRHALAFGLTPELTNAMQNGQVTAVISQSEFVWGPRIVERLLQASNGEPIPELDDTGIADIRS
jgi:ribose transport system substrate-binding protein